MGKFKVDRNKYKLKGLVHTPVNIDPDLYRWLKTMAVVNGASIASTLNQVIEYAKKNSERITV